MKSLTILLLMLLSGITYASDSTLYKKRIEKIRALHEWLTKRPFGVPGIDTSQQMRMYDTVVSKFFDKKQLDSLLAIKTEDDKFPKELQYYFFLAGIATFNELARKQCFDSLLFKPYQADAGLSKEDSIDAENSVVQYFIVNGKEFNYTYFEFKEGSTTLVEIPIMLRERKVTDYYHNLKPCTATDTGKQPNKKINQSPQRKKSR